VIAGHGRVGGPGEVIVQHLAQRVGVEFDVGESLVEAGDGAAIHFVVFAVAAVHFDYGGLVTVGVRIRAGAAECFCPVGGETFDMVGAKAVAESVSDDFVGQHAAMPGCGETLQTFGFARGLENGLHVGMMTIGAQLCKTLASGCSVRAFREAQIVASSASLSQRFRRGYMVEMLRRGKRSSA
jgi:hypothetical protein